MLLAYLFEKFIDTRLKFYKLDSCHYFSSPSLSWDAMLKITEARLEKISDLELYLSLGMKLTKIHKVLKFKHSDWMKKYIDFNTEKRTNAATSFEKDF